MAFGGYFRGLTAYDLLGNLIPGIFTLIAIMGFLSSPPVPTTIGGYGLFVIVAFVIGSLIQAHASRAVGKRNSFDKTMAAVEDLPHLSHRVSGEESDRNEQTAQNGEEDGDKDRRSSGKTWTIFHAFLGPILWWIRPERGEELDDAILVNRIWEHLVDTYEIPYNTESYPVLYHLMSSRIDDIDSPSHATRIQAIRNFHRGMWLTSWYSLLLLVLAPGLQWLSGPGWVTSLGVTYAGPAYADYWTPVWQLAVVAALLTVVFWLLFESTEEDYIEYLFADYAVAISSSDTERSLEPSEITVSGSISATLDSDVDLETRECRDGRTDEGSNPD